MSMGSEFIESEEKGIGRTDPDVLRAQIDLLRQESRHNNKNDL